jgi:hypothetical protein
MLGFQMNIPDVQNIVAEGVLEKYVMIFLLLSRASKCLIIGFQNKADNIVQPDTAVWRFRKTFVCQNKLNCTGHVDRMGNKRNVSEVFKDYPHDVD